MDGRTRNKDGEENEAMGRGKRRRRRRLERRGAKNEVKQEEKEGREQE